jgi:hypothetical protein
MEMNKWLPGRPIIANDILISGFYNGHKDDTEYYDVYTYPTMEYINRFNASRFSGEVKQENTHLIYPELGAYLNDKPFNPPQIFASNRRITMPEEVFSLYDLHRGIGDWELVRDLFPSFTSRDLFLQRILLHRIGYIDHMNDTVIHYNIISYNDIKPFPILVQEYKNRYHKRITGQLWADKNNDLEIWR